MEEAHNPAAPTERGGTERMDKVQIGASSEAGTFEVTPLGTERGQSVTVFSAARVAPVQVLPMPSPTVLQQPAEAIDNSLTPRQAAEISRLQQDFSDRVGGPGQDPNDADYRARWLLASRLSEQDAEIILGSVFMDRYRAALAARQ